MRTIFLDTFPLSASTTRPGDRSKEKTVACREWLRDCNRAGHRLLVPAITHFEVLREMERLGATGEIARLTAFCQAEPERFISITNGDLILAAQLWAQMRQQGTPTASDESLDADVILAAQVRRIAREQSIDDSAYVVATSNTKHIGLMVHAAEWQNIVP